MLHAHPGLSGVRFFMLEGPRFPPFALCMRAQGRYHSQCQQLGFRGRNDMADRFNAEWAKGVIDENVQKAQAFVENPEQINDLLAQL